MRGTNKMMSSILLSLAAMLFGVFGLALFVGGFVWVFKKNPVSTICAIPFLSLAAGLTLKHFGY
jgi:hypothetical protein